MIQRFLELHDSRLEAVETHGGTLEVRLSGYVHQWESSADERAGTGWVMPVALRVAEGSLTGSIDAPAGVWDGSVIVGTEQLDKLIPLPYSAVGDIHLTVELRSGECLEVRGSSLQVVGSLDQRRFVEDLPQDLASWH